MRFLFVSSLGHVPQIFGGVMSNTHEMALELVGRGHDVAVACQLLPSGPLSLQTRVIGKLGWRRTVHDRRLGYRVYRRWDVEAALPELIDQVRPDVVVVQLAQDFRFVPRVEGVASMAYFHDVFFHDLTADPASLTQTVFLANSNFTAGRCRERFRIEVTTIPPIFRARRYQAPRSPTNVTLINPHPYKGVEIALQLVSRCPEIRFRFVKAWALPAEQEGRLADFATAHANLTVDGPTEDMRAVLSSAKIVLTPSIVEEGWGRVASEAQFSGIPVIASSRGGLPEAVGPGGVLLDPDDPIEDWVGALRRLWSDEAFYARLSGASLAHASRAALDPAAQADAFVGAAGRAVALRRQTSDVGA